MKKNTIIISIVTIIIIIAIFSIVLIKKENTADVKEPQPEEKIQIVFQVWDEEKKTYVDVFNKSVEKGSTTKDYVPEVPKRNFYTWDQTWTPPLNEKVNSKMTYKANYVPINDTNKDGVADEEQVMISFQIWDNESKTYKNVVERLVTIGTSTKGLAPSISERQYYTSDQTWTPNLEETATSSQIYKANYIPINDVNENQIADEEDNKYTVIYYSDTKCTQIYKTLENILTGMTIPVVDNPSKNYYKFSGWNSTNKEQIVNANTKLCAIWTPINDTNKDGIADEEQKQGNSQISISDLNLSTKDDKNYTFSYKNETYKATYTTDNWKIYDSYKIRNNADMITICTALIQKHQVHGIDMISYRTAEDMAYEWEQHNLVYDLLPEGHSLKDNAKDVDLNPQDQGKSAMDMFKDRFSN